MVPIKVPRRVPSFSSTPDDVAAQPVCWTRPVLAPPTPSHASPRGLKETSCARSTSDGYEFPRAARWWVVQAAEQEPGAAQVSTSAGSTVLPADGDRCRPRCRCRSRCSRSVTGTTWGYLAFTPTPAGCRLGWVLPVPYAYGLPPPAPRSARLGPAPGTSQPGRGRRSAGVQRTGASVVAWQGPRTGARPTSTAETAPHWPAEGAVVVDPLLARTRRRRLYPCHWRV